MIELKISLPVMTDPNTGGAIFPEEVFMTGTGIVVRYADIDGDVKMIMEWKRAMATVTYK
jgi:hypothetical protein